MSVVPRSAHECKNLLLSCVPEETFQSLVPHLEGIRTPENFLVFERGKPIRHAYFPCSGEHSILATMENGASVEVGTVGFEGFSTIDLLLDADTATETTVCQIPGESLRMPADVFKDMVQRDANLRKIALRYLQAYVSQVTQSVACNRLHTLEQRFARWVLMSHDRVHGDQFRLTQEYLAVMLGVHRPSVSVVAAEFQRQGLMNYSRGVIAILDRSRMEQFACECYGVTKQRFQALFGKDVFCRNQPETNALERSSS